MPGCVTSQSLRSWKLASTFSALILLTGCSRTPSPKPAPTTPSGLVGAWRSSVQFSGGVFAELKDLEFLYVFNAGGTMTESSNYDQAPPVPPAYGVWRETSPRQYEAKYLFYMTKTPTRFEDVARGGGWLPAGHGVLTERILLADDAQSFQSTLTFQAFDSSGQLVPGGGDAKGQGERIAF